MYQSVLDNHLCCGKFGTGIGFCPSIDWKRLGYGLMHQSVFGNRLCMVFALLLIGKVEANV